MSSEIWAKCGLLRFAVVSVLAVTGLCSPGGLAADVRAGQQELLDVVGLAAVAATAAANSAAATAAAMPLPLFLAAAPSVATVCERVLPAARLRWLRRCAGRWGIRAGRNGLRPRCLLALRLNS